MATTPPVSGGATYTHAEEGYFEKRELKRTAGFWGLWGIGVGAVISGDFSGWNGGIGQAGWGGFMIAAVAVVIMYFGMLFSIGEMAAAMPHTGGAYSFARSAMGPWGGFVTGLAESVEYVFTTGVVVLFSADYANGAIDSIFGIDPDNWLSNNMWVWWIVLYAIFLALNIAGPSASFKFAITVSVIAIAILVLFAILAAANGAYDFGSLFDQTPEDGGSKFIPFGFDGVLYALPFAIWLFLGIEELPLAAEESHDPTRDIPRASIWGFVTLIGCGLIVFLLNTPVIGAEAMGASGEPLLDGFRVFMSDQWAGVLSLFALLGLLASLQGIMFAYGRNLYSLSRAGYYPKPLSLTGKAKTPYVALLVGAVIGFVILVVLDQIGRHASEDVAANTNSIVLNIAVWGAVVSYFMQMVSFVVLRNKYPNANRPYLSPWGKPGAVIAAVVAFASFLGILFNPSFRWALYAIVVIYVLGLIYFAVYGRHKLILAPEEEYAMSGGLHRDPEEAMAHVKEHEAELPAEDFTQE